MNYSLWAQEHLTKISILLRNKRVALWQAPSIDGRPTMLLVHGITGDHFGLVPLVSELTKTYNCIIVELPGHGGTTQVRLRSAIELQHWFNDLYAKIEEEIALIDIVCAHSFGCTAVVGENRYAHTKTKTVLLNPVPHPSSLYAQYARLIMQFARFWAFFYNWRIFVFARSATLAKVNSWESRQRIGWVSKYSRPNYRQVVFQAGLVDIILDTTSYSHVKDKIELVVCGIEDTTAEQRDSLELAVVFGVSPVEFLRGGHLLPIESPARVAELIQRFV
jgi:pimeloyl-ACP methyl ester carboxylesterase